MNFNSEQDRMTRKRPLCDQGFNQAKSESRGIKRQRIGIVEVTDRLRRDIQHKLETVSSRSQTLQRIDQAVKKDIKESENPKCKSGQSKEFVCKTDKGGQCSANSSHNNQKAEGLKHEPNLKNSKKGRELPSRTRGLPKQFTLQNPLNFATWIQNINSFMVRTQLYNIDHYISDTVSLFVDATYM